MSARHFDYFDDRWKTEVLECPHCHWLGTFEQGSVEYYAELMDCSCPKCDVFDAPMLAIVSYPTLEELRANQDRPGIREYVERIDAGLDKFARGKLREPEQLPEIDEDSITLTWDFDGSNPDDQRTLIKLGDTVIFSEPARWEEYERFHQIAEILKQRYGKRISDLVPTPRSEMWLWGDKLTAPEYVESVREKLRSQGGTANSGGATVLRNEFTRDETQRSDDRLPVQSLLQFEPGLPTIDAEAFTFTFDYSPDGSRYFVSRGEQVVLIGPAKHNDPDVWGDDDALGEQFIEIALRLKEGYGAKVVDLVPTQRAEKMLNAGNWGFSWSQDQGRSIVQQRSAPLLPSEQRTEVIGRMLELADARYPIEWVTTARERFANGADEKTQRQPDEWPSAYSLFQYRAELPDIDGDKFSVTFDYANDVSRYFVLYGEQVILSGPAEHDVKRSDKDVALRQQFIKIARKLKTRYGAQLVDLVTTQKAESQLLPLSQWITMLFRT